MVGLNLIIPIITEINGLNAPTKRQLIILDLSKSKIQPYVVYKRYLYI